LGFPISNHTKLRNQGEEGREGGREEGGQGAGGGKVSKLKREGRVGCGRK